ncbi:hypothetical protein PF010_g1309 [Phytophthora fragariae]|nr:hypothetical protein PF010_g1309 [Phytophthora fragariae]KAE9255917.1 hypothetical protein PF002_g2121 [Phytophthora fragariae]
MLIISAFFFAVAIGGYTAGGCQLSGNILYSIVDTSNPLGLAPLGFSANRGAVVMSYLFMQMHISMAFSTLMMPPFYMAERLILGMHENAPIVRFDPDADLAHINEDFELQEKQSYVNASTPLSNRQVSTCSLLDKSEGRISHLRAAIELPEEITEEQLRAPYLGAKNKLRYITLRLCVILILVIIAVAAQDKFLDLEDFTGSTAHTVNCMIMPILIYLRIFWRKMSVLDKGVSMVVMVVCGCAGFYVMIHAAKELFSPLDDDTPFPYCDAEYQEVPYYVRNNTN